MNELRKVQKLNNGIWEDIEFQNLKLGDTFRLFESDGEPVINDKGESEFVTISDLYLVDGIWAIE